MGVPSTDLARLSRIARIHKLRTWSVTVIHTGFCLMGFTSSHDFMVVSSLDFKQL